MAMSSNLDERIAEFQQAVGVPAYDEMIERLLRQAAVLKVRLGWYTGSCRSKQVVLYGICYIDIKTLPSSGNLKELVYDLMHELGHWLVPIKLGPGDEKDDALVLGRELRAWKLADTEFYAQPELDADRAEYEAYKRECLRSYEDEHYVPDC